MSLMACPCLPKANGIPLYEIYIPVSVTLKSKKNTAGRYLHLTLLALNEERRRRPTSWYGWDKCNKEY